MLDPEIPQNFTLIPEIPQNFTLILVSYLLVSELPAAIKRKSGATFVVPDFLRRERDSNPRYLSVRRFSRPVQSTTLPPLLGFCCVKWGGLSFWRCKGIAFFFTVQVFWRKNAWKKWFFLFLSVLSCKNWLLCRFFLCVSCVCGIVIIFFLIFVVRFVVWHVIFTLYSYCGVAVLYGEGLLVAKKGYRFVLLFFL